MGLSINTETVILDHHIEHDDYIQKVSIPNVKAGAVIGVSIQTDQTDFGVRGYCDTDGEVTIVYSFQETDEKDTIELDDIEMNISYIQQN